MSKKDRGKSTEASPLADPSRACYPPGNDTGGEAEATVLRFTSPAGKKDDEEEAEEQKDAGEKIDNRVETAEIELAPIAPMSNPRDRDTRTTRSPGDRNSLRRLVRHRSVGGSSSSTRKAHPIAPAARSATREKAVGLLVCCTMLAVAIVRVVRNAIVPIDGGA